MGALRSHDSRDSNHGSRNSKALAKYDAEMAEAKAQETKMTRAKI